jgi:hypothetical protein
LLTAAATERLAEGAKVVVGRGRVVVVVAGALVVVAGAAVVVGAEVGGARPVDRAERPREAVASRVTSRP